MLKLKKLKLKKVAVTGTLAVGKSTVCKFLQEKGAYVVSLDQVVHQLFSTNHEYVKKVVSLLGDEILVQGKVDRKKVAAIVFQSNKKLLKLEKITHPLVDKQLKKEFKRAQKDGKYRLFVVEVPLLFETQDPSWYDAIICVSCPRKMAKKRFMHTTGYCGEEFEARLHRQMAQKEKAAKSHFVIHNNKTKSALKASFESTFQKLIRKI